MTDDERDAMAALKVERDAALRDVKRLEMILWRVRKVLNKWKNASPHVSLVTRGLLVQMNKALEDEGQ